MVYEIISACFILCFVLCMYGSYGGQVGINKIMLCFNYGHSHDGLAP